MNRFIDNIRIVIIQTGEKNIDEKFLFNILQKQRAFPYEISPSEVLPVWIECLREYVVMLRYVIDFVDDSNRSLMKLDRIMAEKNRFRFEIISLSPYLMFKSNRCFRCEFSNPFSFIIIRTILCLSTNIIIEINRISTQTNSNWNPSCQWLILLSFDNRCERNQIIVCFLIESFDKTIDEKG